MSSQERAAASMNPSGWLPGITDAALAHPKEYARGSIGTTEREGYVSIPTLGFARSQASLRRFKRRIYVPWYQILIVPNTNSAIFLAWLLVANSVFVHMESQQGNKHAVLTCSPHRADRNVAK